MFTAVLGSRILASTLPFRERPLRNPALHFVRPYNVRPEHMLGWSSFPSDHGATWFALTAIMFFVSRRVAAALLIYVCFALSLARIYLGTHYPLDIVAGGLLGAGMASMARYAAIRAAVVGRPLFWMNRAPQLFYPCFFVITAQMAEGFISTIELGRLFYSSVRATLRLIESCRQYGKFLRVPTLMLRLGRFCQCAVDGFVRSSLGRKILVQDHEDWRSRMRDGKVTAC